MWWHAFIPLWNLQHHQGRRHLPPPQASSPAAPCFSPLATDNTRMLQSLLLVFVFQSFRSIESYSMYLSVFTFHTHHNHFEFHSYWSMLLLTSLPLDDYATVCISTHLLIGIWVVFNFWQLKIKVLWIFMYMHCISICFFRVNI